MTVVKTKIRQDPLINKVLFNSDTVRPYRSLAARAIRMYLSQVTRTVGHSVAASPATCTKFSRSDHHREVVLQQAVHLEAVMQAVHPSWVPREAPREHEHHYLDRESA